MKCLIVIPHIFKPTENSKYSSQMSSKRESKQIGLMRASVENMNRHKKTHWIHASLGFKKDIVTRRMETNSGVDMTIQIYTKKGANLTEGIYREENIEIIYVDEIDNLLIPQYASRRLLEQADDYDVLGYMEDDILIEDPEFFEKVKYFQDNLGEEYTILPHRCEYIPGRGDVILSGDPDGGRPDLFWDTKEKLEINWPTGMKTVYRATNPHSGCFFISKLQAKKMRNIWEQRNWQSPFELSGPLEQAASGRLIEGLKLLKPCPEDYRFFMVRHQDQLWQKHKFENSK